MIVVLLHFYYVSVLQLFPCSKALPFGVFLLGGMDSPKFGVHAPLRAKGINVGWGEADRKRSDNGGITQKQTWDI